MAGPEARAVAVDGHVAVILEPRYAAIMPWLLIVLGLGLALGSFAWRDHMRRDSVAVVRKPATQTTPSRRAAHRDPRLAAQRTVAADPLPVVSQTTTERPVAETTFAALLGIGALLVVVGAFYTRITKITIAGNSIDLTTVATVADGDAIAKWLGRHADAKLKTAAHDGTVPAEDAAKITQDAITAATRVQQETVRMRLAGVSSVTTVPVSTVAPKQVAGLGAGMPLPDELLKKLADKALADVS